ncbi:MAG: PPC domain-containing protein [Gemmataceae bacterium]
MMNRLSIALAVLLCLTQAATMKAQQKQPKKKQPPKITMILPLGAISGTKEKFTIRGLGLDKTTEVEFVNSEVKVKLLQKGKAQVRDKNPQQAGDTQVVVELDIPKSIEGPVLDFVVITPEGKSQTHRLLLPGSLPMVKEKEKNEGFQTAQKVSVPQIVRGRIDNQRDVDVYSFDGKAGERIQIEVFGQRHGSVMDSMITLFDGNGQQVAFNDDGDDKTTDSKILAILPKTGMYHISLIEANDRGGATYPYWLVVQLAKQK